MNSWQFENWKTGSMHGWNHGISTNFRNNTLKNLVRETIQNSLDNREDSKPAVIVEFNEHTVSSDKIPSMLDLTDVIRKCLKDAEKRATNDETINGLKRAHDHSTRKMIKVLEIADYNTTGMKGPAKVGNPFHNFLFTEGDSTKGSVDAGSHGHGKFAPLTNSELRTMFVSTKWKENNEEKTLFQGMTLLCSRTSDDDTSLSNKGYWGADNFQPLSEIPDEFNWMSREKVGTSIFLVGWDSREFWQAQLIGHAISNFFAALHKEELIIRTNDARPSDTNKHVISAADDFKKYFETQKIKDAMKNDSQLSEQIFTNAQFYHKCLMSNEATSKETQIGQTPGLCELKLILDENAPKRIAFVRNNILITDQIPGFWKNPPSSLNGFAGIFEIKDTEGRNLFRRMENPTHTELSDTQLPLHDQKSGKKALKAVADKLKILSKEFAQIETERISGPVEILKNFFSDFAGDGEDYLENEDIDPNGKFLISARPWKAPPAPMKDYGEDDDDAENAANPDGLGDVGGGDTFHGEDGGTKIEFGDGNGDGEGDNDGGTGDNSLDKTKAPPHDTLVAQNKRVTKIDGKLVNFVYAPFEPNTVRIHLSETGADFSEKIKIESADKGDVVDGYLELKFTDSTPQKVQITCERIISGGVKLTVDSC